MRSQHRTILAGSVCAALVAALALPALACDTPVWEYTLHNWRRDPYRVYYLHSGAEAAADAQVNRYLGDAAESPNVNLLFARMDPSKVDAGASREERFVAARYKTKPLPLHVVLNPRGGELFAGRLDLKTARALVDSPQRKRLAELLCEGKQGVLLVLLAGDETQDAKARGVVHEVVSEALKEECDVGVIEVARGDPKERWLVAQLLLLEDDLKGLDTAMVFGVFGRAHALEPFLGKGITWANIADLVMFMNGPCTCQIKATAWGMDLLTNWDWDKHAGELPELGRPAELGGFVTFGDENEE